MLETYKEMRDRQQKEFNELNIKFAFSQKQFDEILQEFGVTEDEAKDKLTHIGGGGYMLKEESHTLLEQIDKADKELHEAIDNDKDGTGFIKDMFKYEMWNHELAYSHDEDEVAVACGLDEDEITNNLSLKIGYILAREEYFKEFNALNG